MMPLGHDCEYPDFDACVRDQMSRGHSRKQAEKICGSLQEETEEKCRKRKERRAGPLPEEDGDE